MNNADCALSVSKCWRMRNVTTARRANALPRLIGFSMMRGARKRARPSGSTANGLTTGFHALALIRFTANYQDLSTERGYQFKFMCNKRNNG